jgi:hypothetical protein
MPRGRPPLPPEARKPKTSGPSGLVRLPTDDEREQIRAIVADLQAHLATSPEAAGRSRLDGEGVLLAPQALVAEKARVRPEDLSATLNGRRPSSVSVATMLVRLMLVQG